MRSSQGQFFQFRAVQGVKGKLEREARRGEEGSVGADATGSKQYQLAANDKDDELETMPFGRDAASTKYADVDALYGSDENHARGGATFHLKEEEHHLEALQKMNAFECKDYDVNDSILNKLTNSVKSKKEYNLREALCWLLPIVIGILMGFTAFVVDIGIE